MTTIRVSDLHKAAMQNPAYRKEWDALEEQFSLARAMINARAEVDLTRNSSPSACTPPKP
jgi:hypothetical protein